MSHSPLQRCEQLARYLIALRPDLASNPDPRLREMDFGDWEGRPWADIARSEIDAWTQDFAHPPPGGGENLHSMLARVTQHGAKPSRPGARPPRGVDHARRRHALRGVAEQSRRQTAAIAPMAAGSARLGDWVMVRPGLTGEAPVQQT